jgi:hypothetical protein
MKKLTIIAALLLTGCSFIMPVAHDPAEASKFTDVKLDVEKVACVEKNRADWDKLIEDARWLDMYTAWRQDPQQKAVTEFYVSMQKARDGSPAYCEATMKLNKTRLEVIEKSWKGR